MKIHYVHNYLRQPVHRVTIDLVGCGGTGSQVLTNLARMNEALLGLGHPGFFVRAWDHDSVTTSNMGRQLFSASDLGMNKAIVLISRVNRFFGTDWLAYNRKYTGAMTSNILITCVDTAAARLGISAELKVPANAEPYDIPYYWLDFGNLQKTGQVVLGTVQAIRQPKKENARVLKTVVKMFPGLKRVNEADQGPSCSLAEALTKQDLFINSTLAQFGCNLLWKLIKEGELTHQGCFVNLETLSVNPIKIA